MTYFDLDKYLKSNKDGLSFEEAQKIYNLIFESAQLDDEVFKELWKDALEAASKYALKRNEWDVIPYTERRPHGELRSSLHNAYMDTLTILARYYENQGWNTSWIDMLWDRKVYRKRWGDFSGYLLLFGVLRAR